MKCTQERLWVGMNFPLSVVQVERLVAADSWQAKAKSVAVQASQDFQQGLTDKQIAVGPPM